MLDLMLLLSHCLALLYLVPQLHHAVTHVLIAPLLLCVLVEPSTILLSQCTCSIVLVVVHALPWCYCPCFTMLAVVPCISLLSLALLSVVQLLHLNMLFHAPYCTMLLQYTILLHPSHHAALLWGIQHSMLTQHVAPAGCSKSDPNLVNILDPMHL